MADSASMPRMSRACLGDVALTNPQKLLNPQSLSLFGGITDKTPVLLVLAAGKGTRFGTEPKCIQPVHGTPLARHSIEAFRRFRAAPVICVVGYCHERVSTALGEDNVYVLSSNPVGGTALAALEAFSVPELADRNPPLIITMGDRIVSSSVFRHLWRTHRRGPREAELTMLTAQYEPPRNRGKGRVVRDQRGRVLRIVEERDIPTAAEGLARRLLLDVTEGNCPLYVVRAKTLLRHLPKLENANAQGQFYLTDIVEAISREGGAIRTVTTTAADPEYDLLCCDVTQPMDLALLEGIVASATGLLSVEELEVEEAAGAIAAGRPGCQVASIARQLEELAAMAASERLGFQADRPLAIGISGGRLRIAFMHPDMLRFYGPAWQMPIGAGRPDGNEQIIVLAQSTDDRRINLYPMNPEYRESINFVSDDAIMYPDAHICDLHTYEQFGTRMSETLLLSLGYFSDEELEQRRKRGLPLPPASRWLGGNMRRPFALVGNAIASMRTLRAGNLGAKVQEHLGRDQFTGLRLASTGSIPQGGFSSSSAVTVAVKNALNALYQLGLSPDLLVHLACQAEYGTGVRAGSLDQATEQKGRAGRGTLISSNPKDNYRILGTYPVPADRFHILFPYSVERDRAAWQWSWGAYAESAGDGPLTALEVRKMTGKAAEIAALLTRLPLETDFFKQIEDDLVADGLLTVETRRNIGSLLQRIPLLISRADLAERIEAQRDWLLDQMAVMHHLDRPTAEEKASATLAGLLSGWREPILRRGTAGGNMVEERGVPLRAMVAYLFGEVAKNFYLIHHPAQWIEYVTLSQRGDRFADLAPERLPGRADLEQPLDWERGCSGPDLLDRWLTRHGATPIDYNRGLSDEALSAPEPPEFHRMEGSNFFRGLALIDLAEAMLKRAFGTDAVAVRVNAAGQGDYFQVHVDTEKADLDDVKEFLRRAYYRRFGLAPDPEFVELHPGGGAVGTRLSRADSLPQLIRRLKAHGADA